MTVPVPTPPPGEPRGRPRVIVFLPLLLFAGLAAVFYVRLGAGDASRIPSALIDRPAPDFALPPVEGLIRDGAPVSGFSRADLLGKVSVVNVFASWCAPCREEHPLLMEIAGDERFALYGLNYKDGAANAVRFLGALGNPYAAVGADPSGRTGIDWGVYGVPETFVVRADGTIAYKHIGPIDAESLKTRLMPEIEKALATPARG